MKIYAITKHTLIITAVVIIFCIGIIYSQSAIMISAKEKRDLPIYCVEKTEKICAISFDAAWGNEDTEMLIDILNKYKVKTTFFVVGQWVDKFPESVKALSDAGHEVMNHSNTHPHMAKLSVEEMKKEILGCDEKIKKITGKTPILFRPPYGEYNNAVVGVCRELAHYTIQWDVDSLDWKDLSASEITNRVTKRVKPGSIVLFHNAAKNTPAALPSILEALIKDGYKIVPVSELIMKNDFEIDHSGKQIPKIAQTVSSLD